MLKKTNKLRALEKQRFSILTENLDCCFICREKKVDMHEIYGGANRVVSMRNGFCVPLCRHHHRQITNDNSLSLYLKTMCQQQFEQTHNKDEFIKLIGRNYL